MRGTVFQARGSRLGHRVRRCLTIWYLPLMITRPPRIDQLEWDEWNLDHIQKHGVTVTEVAEVPISDAMYQTTYKNRIMVTGPTSSGRMLTIVVGESPYQRYHWYVFSARPASRTERRDYADREAGGQPQP